MQTLYIFTCYRNIERKKKEQAAIIYNTWHFMTRFFVFIHHCLMNDHTYFRFIFIQFSVHLTKKKTNGFFNHTHTPNISAKFLYTVYSQNIKTCDVSFFLYTRRKKKQVQTDGFCDNFDAFFYETIIEITTNEKISHFSKQTSHFFRRRKKKCIAAKIHANLTMCHTHFTHIHFESTLLRVRIR